LRLNEAGESVECDVEEDTKTEDSQSELLAPAYLHLHKAKPTTLSTLPWGDSSSVPDADGLYFAYAEPLASPDRDTVPQLIERYFLKSFGRDGPTQLKAGMEIRKAWGIVATTLSGSCLAHLAKVIDIALQAQATVFPIFQSGVYEGCVLSGSGYHVHIGEKVWAPLSAEELKKVVRDNDSQEKALSNISAVVAEDISDVTSMRELHRILLQKSLSADERDQVLSNAKQLRFNQKYWSVNATTIETMLQTLQSTTQEESELEHQPLHPSALFSTDWTTLVLASFGHSAPAPNISAAPKLHIKGDSKPPTCLAVRSADLVDAVREWKQLPETKYCTNNPSNLSRKFQCRSFTGKEKVQVWNAMKKYCNSGVGVKESVGEGDEAKEEAESAFDL
jgi:hypothetical protein